MGPDQVLELTSLDEVRELVEPWRDLVARTGGSYFQLPDWVMGWWSTIGGKAPTTLATWNGADGLEAIAFVSRVRSRLHPKVPLSVSTIVNSGSGQGGGDHLGFPALGSRRDDVAGWLASLRGGSLVLSNVAQASADQVPADAAQFEVSPCPRLTLEKGIQVGRTSRYRKQYRWMVRKVRAEGVTFRLVEPEDFDPELLDVLMDLHERRWTDKEGDSTFTRFSLDLQRQLVMTAGPGRGPSAVVASGPDGPIGIVYGLIWNGTFSFYQSGWDNEWAPLGLGTVLNAVAIEELAESGYQVYDFLRGTEEYKYRFGATDLVDRSFLLPRGVGGLTLRLKSRLKARGSNGDVDDATPNSPDDV